MCKRKVCVGCRRQSQRERECKGSVVTGLMSKCSEAKRERIEKNCSKREKWHGRYVNER